MDSISRLRSLLLNAFSPRGLQKDEQELFDELMLHKSCLLSILDVGPRSAQEQSELQSGKILINGQHLAVNPEFARPVIFLSQHLDCSERYIAGILHGVMTDNPNTSLVQCLESAVVEFHQRRRHLVDSLRYLFEAAAAATSTESPPIYVRLDAFIRQNLIPATKVSTGEPSLASRILDEIEKLDGVISKALDARQNATSSSCGDGRLALGHDILNARYESLKYDRRVLAITLCFVSRRGYLPPKEIRRIIDWLAGNPRHSMTHYMLTTVLVAFDPADPQSMVGKIRTSLALDQDMPSFMKKKLDHSSVWKEPRLKATILLKWALFLTEARHHDPSLEHREGFSTDELESHVWDAVHWDAFTYLALSVLQLQGREGDTSSSYITYLSSQFEQDLLLDLPSEDMQFMFLQAFETLVRSLLIYASSELRKIKQRQEDLVLANARSDRTKFFRSTTSPSTNRLPSTPELDNPPSPPRNDIAMLYTFIGLLYSVLPDERALQFWASELHADLHQVTYIERVESAAGKLPAFLQWAVWSTQTRDVDLLMALYDMLSGLAKGQLCSELAYNFMAKGAGEVIPGSTLLSSFNPTHFGTGPVLSWSIMFRFLESWASPAQSARSEQAHLDTANAGSRLHPWNTASLSSSQMHRPSAFGPKDVFLAQSFLRFLSRVAKHSVAVRIAISGHGHFRAIPTLMALIPLGVPLELKGAIFRTLASFCRPGAGVAGIEICKAVWTLMERLEVINVRGSDGTMATGASLLQAAKGVEVELEEVESVHKTYPATIPFLQLLCTLIHTPKSLPLRDRVLDVETVNTIPDTLGQPYRSPGVGPYVSFVIDIVFLGIPGREYARPSDRWQINDLCLCFIERVLASYDLESLTGCTDDYLLKSDVIIPLLIHPGNDIMKRLLTNSPLQSSLLSYLVEGVEGFGTEFAGCEPHFRSTVTRLLRIILRALELQDIFIDILLPLLGDVDGTTFTERIPSRSYFTKLDQALSFNPQCVPAIAAYVSFPAQAELGLLAIKILALLSASSATTNLATLVERSSDSELILTGFEQIMRSESAADVVTAETIAEQTTGAGAPDVGPSSEALEQAVRLAALQLFIQNTGPGRPYPNIAHFLLFGGRNGEHVIQDPHALGARQTCIHVIIDLLNIGVPRSNKRVTFRRGRALHTDPLFTALPVFAERCYRIIHQLCVHARTSDFMMRYLRTREDFFARQLAAIPSKAPDTPDTPLIHIAYADSSRVSTNTSVLTSFLRLRSLIFDLVALELHVLTNKGHLKGVDELLSIVFGNEQDVFATVDDVAVQPSQDFGRSHLRIVEFIQSLNFDWLDSLAVEPTNLELLGHVDFLSCIRVDAVGCEVIDKTAVTSLITKAKRHLQSQGNVITSTQNAQLASEVTYILESCVVENHRREVHHATATGYEAWNRLLCITLTKCFMRLPYDHRESILFDLLHTASNIINSVDIQEPTAVLLSEAILSLITKLREDRHHQEIVPTTGTDAIAGSLPVERLHDLLRSILGCILNSNFVDIVRGNLYASLVNYVALVSMARVTSKFCEKDRSLSLAREDRGSHGSQSTTVFEQSLSVPSSLEAATRALINQNITRLVVIVCRDAIDGTEVWKTVAFMLLDCLIHLCRLETRQSVLAVLVRHGILSNFVQGVRELDPRLQSILKPDPDDLNALYVYEAQMSFFVRIAQTRQGAERLLEARLLPVLSQCDYLDARPEVDQSFINHDSFLPSAIQRYHQLLIPALQVVNCILASLGSSHSTAVNQALHFLSSHRDTIVILLKTEMDDISPGLGEEFYMLISLCATVLPSAVPSDLLSSSSFGGIHEAILTLAARCLGNRLRIRDVPEHNDTAMFAVDYSTPDHSATSFSDISREERQLRKAIVMYIGAMSDIAEREMTAILSPVTAVSRHAHGESRFSATIPTIGDAVQALDDFCTAVAGISKQIIDLSVELASTNHGDVKNIQKTITLSDLSSLRELDVGQTRSVTFRELETVRESAREEVIAMLETTEMLLLILWRHLLYFTDRGNILKPSDSALPVSSGSTPSDLNKFRSELGNRLASILQRLLGLNMDYETLGTTWRASETYLEIMCRRLRDILHLHDSTQITASGGK